MKLAVTPCSITDVVDVISAGADIIIAGNGRFANRLVVSFTVSELQDITTTVHARKKQLYVPVNIIVHQADLSELETYLETLVSIGVDGILFGDLAVYQLAKTKGLDTSLVYHPETLNTNAYDQVFWAKRGIEGIVLAKEITLADIVSFPTDKPLDLWMIGHGYLNMFHSRRPLVENYFKFNNKAYDDYLNNRNLRLVEEIRNESYPVFQDEHGTHIFRDKIMMSYLDVGRLSDVIDVFVVDWILQDPTELITTVQAYASLRDSFDEAKAQELHEQHQSTHDTGFLHKETVYVKS